MYTRVKSVFCLIGTAYTGVTSGSTCERVTSKADCEQAARQLGLSVTVAKVVTESDWPPNCYFYNGDSHGNGKTLYFNNDHNAASECNPGSRVCICKKTSGIIFSDY